MTRLQYLTRCLTFATFFASIPAIASAEDVVLRYNQWFPTQHWSHVDGIYMWFDRVAEVTEGRVRIEPSAAPLAPPNRNFQAVEQGIADVAWGPHGYTPGVFPLSELVELPFITTDARASSIAYWRTWKKYFEPSGMQSSVITLAMHVTAPGNLHFATDIPARDVEDLTGTRIRIPTPVVARALQNLGAIPVASSLTELREMLARGIVDGAAISDEFLIGFGMDGHVEAATEIPGGLFTSSIFLIVNRDAWNRIDAVDRAAIEAISGEMFSAEMGALWDENYAAAQDTLRERLGGAYIRADDTFLEGLAAAFEPETDAWLAAAEAAGVDGPSALAFFQTERERAASGD